MIKPLRTIWILIFLLFAQKGYSQSAGTVNTIGGWIEVTPLGNAKYRIDCQLLMALGGALTVAPNHHKRVRRALKASTSGIYFIEIEGAGNQIKWVVE